MFFWHVITDEQRKEIEVLLWETQGKIIRPGIIRRTVMYHGIQFEGEVLFCQKCGVYMPDGFMVHDAIWNQIGLDGIICPPCFEVLLGRKLDLTDLPNYPINGQIRRGLTSV